MSQSIPAKKSNPLSLTQPRGLSSKIKKIFATSLLALGLSVPSLLHAASVELLNVSYDPTRELYQEYNAYFVKNWKTKTGDDVTIQQSHGGSGKQARAVVDGLNADVVTLGLGYDIDVLADKGLLGKDWQKALPSNSAPYTSTIVFLVRKGNPKGIKDWGDLVKPGVAVITPNPKTSGGARWNFLAALAYAQAKLGKEDGKAVEFIKALYKNVPVLDSGARGATTTFAQRGLGDVLITWENEAFLSIKEFGSDKFEIVAPSISVLAEPPVAVVTKNADHKGTSKVAAAYVELLFSEEAQEIIGKNFYRPRSATVAAKYANQFPKIELVTIESFGGWRVAQHQYFDDGGLFDAIYAGNN